MLGKASRPPRQGGVRPGEYAERGIRTRSLWRIALLRQPLLLLSRSDQVNRLVSTMPVTAGIVRGYVPGETTDGVVEASAAEIAEGIRVTLDFLGET